MNPMDALLIDAKINLIMAAIILLALTVAWLYNDDDDGDDDNDLKEKYV